MAFIIAYPAIAALSMFVLGIIIVILRFGPKLCGLRHHALPDDHEWEEDHVYDQQVSYA